MIKKLSLFFLFSCFLVFNEVIADDIVHGTGAVSYDSQTFPDAVTSKPHFVMFFAPWCGHCKRLSPTWDELAVKYKEGQILTIGKVDCTLHTPLCSSQEVTGYPTLKFFGKGIENGIKYKGPRDLLSFEKFIHEQLGINFEDDGTPEAPVASSGLVEFTKESFEQTKAGKYFIKFYAPWCGHCQRLAPVWEALAKSWEHDKSVIIGKIDCTKYGQFCNDYDVKGYPTLLWIQDGKKMEKYSGDRSHEDLKTFVMNQLGVHEKSIPSYQENPDKQAPVVVLTSENFQNAVDTGITFIQYFAPWCGHCKRLAPIYDELSRKYIGHNVVKIAKVDCTEHVNRDLCSEQQVNDFPTLVLYQDGEKIAEYDGDRSLEDMVSFISLKIPHDEL